MSWLLRFMMVLIFNAAMVPAYAEENADFDAWLTQFKAQAARKGISEETLARALDGLTPDDTVIGLDRKQPESKITLEKYLKNTINARRINIGKNLLHEYADLLDTISDSYDVQPQYLLALWGIESDYGNHQGGFSVIRSLATLAYEGRRRELFANELIAALKIIEREGMEPSELTGSWAGAMGNCQFMPTTYLRYAVDQDGDGKRDIWSNTADSLASIANYLHSLGWKDNRGWGAAAEFPDGIASDITVAHRASYWRAQGVSWEAMGDQFDENVALYAIYADKANHMPYLVTDNYKAILQWNRSRYFATAVGTLADHLVQ